MFDQVSSSITNETRYILTVGIGKSSFPAIDCIYHEELKYVDYLLVDPTNTERGEIIQTIDRELDDCKFIVLVCSLEDVVDYSLINSIVNFSTEILVQTFLLFIIPEEMTNNDDKSKLKSELSQLSKNINLVIPVRADTRKSIVGKNSDSKRFCNSDYHTMWIVKTINSIAFDMGYISTDYTDVSHAIKMKGFGYYSMGEFSGNSSDQHRCMEAFHNLVSIQKNALVNIAKAKNLLVMIDSGPKDISIDEIMELIKYLNDDLNSVADFVWNCNFYELQERVRVTIIGTGFYDISTLI